MSKRKFLDQVAAATMELTGTLTNMMWDGNYLLEDENPKSPPKPCSSAVLWRYMTFEKYIDMLFRRGAFFSYPCKLEDRHEAVLPRTTYKRLLVRLQQIMPGFEYYHNGILQMISDNLRNQHVVSCWHEMKHESHTMWRAYANRGTGITVQTSFESLQKAFTSCAESGVKYVAGKVDYINYDTDDISMSEGMPLFYKREIFRTEHEVRIARFAKANNDSPGVLCETDIDELVHKVVISPFTKDWEFEVVKATTAKFNKSLVDKIEFSTQ
ncbi:MAG: DUF2971 domain-containing protein [Gemmatimonadetes bacterium]|nr:DUF2971 domain-containing protein [Gemmatimonadota bacterium]